MIFAISQIQTTRATLDDRRRHASTERLLRLRPRRAPRVRYALASTLRRIADAVEPRTVHRHAPHLPS